MSSTVRSSTAAPTLNFYCIDIDTNTFNGIGYQHGTWDDSNVPHVGLRRADPQRVLPQRARRQPAGLMTSQQAAAVQAAIWFFSDSYVLNVSDPLHDVVAAIANHVILQGPFVEPPPPTLHIDPDTARGPAGQHRRSVRGQLRHRLRPRSPRPAARRCSPTPPAHPADREAAPRCLTGTFIWLRSGSPGTATLKATAISTFPSGNVYLYDDSAAALSAAQKLIVAKTETAQTTVRRKATFKAPGSLIVTKTIAGAAAGQQGPVTIHVDCGAAAGTLADFVIPAAPRPARPLARLRRHPSRRRLHGHRDGRRAQLDGLGRRSPGSGQHVTIPAGRRGHRGDHGHLHRDARARCRAQDHRRSRGGPPGCRHDRGACGRRRRPDFVIPAGAPAGTSSKTYAEIPGGDDLHGHRDGQRREPGHHASTVTGRQPAGRPSHPAGSPRANAITRQLPPRTRFAVRDQGDRRCGRGAAGPDHDHGHLRRCRPRSPSSRSRPARREAPRRPTPTSPPPATCTVIEEPDGHTDTRRGDQGGQWEPVAMPPGGTATVDPDRHLHQDARSSSS